MDRTSIVKGQKRIENKGKTELFTKLHLLNGIQEVRGSIPLISTRRKTREALIYKGSRAFSYVI